MLRYHERAEEVVSTVGHPELHRNIALPPTAGLRDWKTALSPAEVKAYIAAAGITLERFGYPTDGYASRRRRSPPGVGRAPAVGVHARRAETPRRRPHLTGNR